MLSIRYVRTLPEGMYMWQNISNSQRAADALAGGRVGLENPAAED